MLYPNIRRLQEAETLLAEGLGLISLRPGHHIIDGKKAEVSRIWCCAFDYSASRLPVVSVATLKMDKTDSTLYRSALVYEQDEIAEKAHSKNLPSDPLEWFFHDPIIIDAAKSGGLDGVRIDLFIADFFGPTFNISFDNAADFHLKKLQSTLLDFLNSYGN
ncbi:MAG TPA: hypothetical protein PL048_11660 [Leptospiraceae bacterium]|nr:hypothetical protein [Leptospiraceae bacterium]HMY65145.1 hypothetical protein [Leptospiraceae bacterium]HMZ59425.1 hypothetical protein [Leptospiraceae bacterium]HNF15266.1 hypothetical protein [Leptospiraceae bacterium]HNF23129.1 hypothetical protein [Leptospiraceae bacterium]